MVETFKTIEGYENYSVSDHGNVRNDKTGRILKEKENRYGYKSVSDNEQNIELKTTRLLVDFLLYIVFDCTELEIVNFGYLSFAFYTPSLPE